MNVDLAFTRAAAIEGVASIAFPKFARALTSGEMQSRASLSVAFLIGEGDGEDIDFAIGANFWEHFVVRLADRRLIIESLKSIDSLEKETQGFMMENGRLFSFEDGWEISVSVESFENCFLTDRAPALAKMMSTRKGAGGAPTKYYWSRAAGYAAAYIVENSYDKGQVDLIEKLQDWFVRTGGRSPDRRDVERFVSEMFAATALVEKARRKT